MDRRETLLRKLGKFKESAKPASKEDVVQGALDKRLEAWLHEDDSPASEEQEVRVTRRRVRE
jgi:hypothetical protein